MRMGLYSRTNSSAIFSRPIVGGRIVNDDGSNVIIFDHSNNVVTYYWHTEDAVFTSSTYTNTYSMLFDGVNEYVAVSDHNDFSFGDSSNDSPFSVSVWAKASDLTSSGIIGKGYAGFLGEWEFYFNSVDKINLRLGDGFLVWISKYGTSALTSDEGTWHHYVATYDGSGASSGIKLYRDSTEITSTTTSDYGTYVAMDNTTNIPTFGLSGLGNGAKYFDGKLDEVTVWSVELNSSEVTKLYNNGVAGFDLATATSNLKAWWRCGEGSSGSNTDGTTTVYDMSTNTHNGTLTNMSSTYGDIYKEDIAE